MKGPAMRRPFFVGMKNALQRADLCKAFFGASASVTVRG